MKIPRIYFCISVRPAALVFGALFLICSEAAYAQWKISVGAGARQVSMQEIAGNGQRLVQERGWLPGLELGATYASQNWRFRIRGETYRSDIGYEGQLQNGAAFSTTTGTVQDRLAFEVERQINASLILLGGVELDRWQRRIQGSASVLGLDENYRSTRLLLGAGSATMKTSYFDVSTKALLVIAQPEQLHVSFGNQLFDDAEFETKSATGLRLEADLIPAGAPDILLGLSFDTLRIGRSNDAVLTKNGLAVGFVSQPEHRRNAFTLRVRYQF